jgi:hypothetical protein
LVPSESQSEEEELWSWGLEGGRGNSVNIRHTSQKQGKKRKSRSHLPLFHPNCPAGNPADPPAIHTHLGQTNSKPTLKAARVGFLPRRREKSTEEERRRAIWRINVTDVKMSTSS